MLKGLLGAVSGAISNAAQATGLTQFATKDVAEAAVGICLKIAHADGEMGEKEKAKIKAIFQNSDLLAPFSPEVIETKRNALMKALSWDVDEGIVACDKEIREAAGFSLEAREALGRMAVMVAKAEASEGQSAVSDEERQAVREVFDMLRLDFSTARL
jgi:tellurite resistance protein